MPVDLDHLPDDVALLQQMLRDLVREMNAENDKLRLLIQRLTRHQFGRRSEQLTDDQLQLGLEDLEQAVAEREAAEEAVSHCQGRRSVAQRGQSAISATCRHICRVTKLCSMPSPKNARAAVG